MQNIYLCCLTIGVLFSLSSFILNGILDSFDFDIGLELFGLPIKFTSLIVSATVFGGCGLLTPSIFYGLPAAVFGGIITYIIFTYLFFVVLPRYQTQTKGQEDAVNLEADVIVSILPGKLGKISYVVDGNIISSLAREKIEDGNGIRKGTRVKILEYKDGAYIVCPVEAVAILQQ